MDIHSQGAAAEVQRSWSDLCCLPNGRNQASSLLDLQNHPKVKYPTFFPGLTPISPSPDWIVGVSMENLCLANGSWVDSRVVDLYPWDAGNHRVFQIYVSILRNQAPTLALATTIMAIRRFREKQFTGESLMKS